MKKTIFKSAVMAAFITMGMLATSHKAAAQNLPKPGDFWFVEDNRSQPQKDEPSYVLTLVFEVPDGDYYTRQAIKKQFEDQLVIEFPKTHSWYSLNEVINNFNSYNAAQDALRAEEAKLTNMGITYKVINFTFYKH